MKLDEEEKDQLEEEEEKEGYKGRRIPDFLGADGEEETGHEELLPQLADKQHATRDAIQNRKRERDWNIRIS